MQTRQAYKAYNGFCYEAKTLKQLRPAGRVIQAVDDLAWAIREKKQERNGDFLPHAERFVKEVGAFLQDDNII